MGLLFLIYNPTWHYNCKTGFFRDHLWFQGITLSIKNETAKWLQKNDVWFLVIILGSYMFSWWTRIIKTSWLSYKDHIWFLWFNTKIVQRNQVWTAWNHIWTLYEIEETSIWVLHQSYISTYRLIVQHRVIHALCIVEPNSSFFQLRPLT